MLQYQNLEMKDHMQVFTLEQLGVDCTALIRFLAPVYEHLPWDLYDLRRQQTDLLLQAVAPAAPELANLCVDYYAGKFDISALSPYIDRLPAAEQERFGQIKPFRKRAIATFLLSRGEGDSWQVREQAHETFVMDTEDHRQYGRTFMPIAAAITTSELVENLLTGVARLVCEQQPMVTKIRLVMHLMRTVVYRGGRSSNSPEGVHQDGSDYIVSALVIGRYGVEGGTSRVYGSDKQTLLLSHTL